jgi:hypothetical protein
MVRLVSSRPRLASSPPRLAARPKQAIGFGGFDYRSAEWKALKARRRMDADYRKGCGKCGASGRLILDHVVELRDGGAPLDSANTEWLCPSCHGAKTEQRKRQRFGMA